MRAYARIGLFLLLPAAWALGSCTAWEYDITQCDPTARSPSRDVCSSLNTDPMACQLYQCDGSTSTCKLSVRDLDHDGDPDQACGGTDCNDYDPSINGLDGHTCACSPSQINQPCKKGLAGSACERSANYLCSNNMLVCPTTPSSPMSWQPSPDPVNNSWDWNCDGTVDKACSYMDFTGRYYVENCPVTPAANCTQTVLDQINNNMSSQLCSNYCSSFKSSATCQDPKNQPYIFNCNYECGVKVGVCVCYWTQTVLGSCAAQNYSTIGSVYCR